MTGVLAASQINLLYDFFLLTSNAGTKYGAVLTSFKTHWVYITSAPANFMATEGITAYWYISAQKKFSDLAQLKTHKKTL